MGSVGIMGKHYRVAFTFTFILFIQSALITRPTCSQSPQQQVQLPEVLRRLSLPYHICTRTVDNLWECVSSSSIDNNSSINSIDTVTKTPDKNDGNVDDKDTTTAPDVSTTLTDLPAYGTTTTSSTAKEQKPTTTCAPVTSSNEMPSDLPNTNNADSNNPIQTDKLIFEDEFNRFDLENWTHDVTMSGGGNWEFQIYVNNRSNSFVRNGMLHINPTLTSDTYGEEFLSSGFLSLHGDSPADQCTNPWGGGCEKQGNATNIINPVMSAKIRTTYCFAFKYGRVEIRAKLPTGDWLRPGISLLPFKYNYGRWPASGEIHIVESRGNKDLGDANGQNIGVNQVSSSLDFGPFFRFNGKENAEFKTVSDVAFDEDFHIYELEWNEDFIRFSIDGNETGKIEPTQQGFWELGNFDNIYSNPWENSENIKMAPFDQKFYLAINLAVGGTTGYFPDDSVGPTKKPWFDLSSTAYKEFWSRRSDWLPSWENSSFIIDYVRVFSS